MHRGREMQVIAGNKTGDMLPVSAQGGAAPMGELCDWKAERAGVGIIKEVRLCKRL